MKQLKLEGHLYEVKWNIQEQLAEGYKDGELLGHFTSELEAWGFLIQLAEIKDLYSWREITERSDEPSTTS